MGVVLTASIPRAVASPPLMTQSFDVHIPARPAVVRSDGKTVLAYELHVTNFSSDEVAIRRVSAINFRNEQPVDVLEGERLKAARSAIASPAGPDDGRLSAGMRAVIYFWIELRGGGEVPRRLVHQIEYESDGARLITSSTPVEISERSAVVLGPPLTGGPWAAVYDPQLNRGHRRVLYAVEGSARIPGRFAIDWFRLNERGQSFAGERGDVSKWFGYGESVIAVADGVIASVRDGMGEHVTSARTSRRDLRDGSGNFVVLSLGDGRFAFYEHLKPGSIRVKHGERVRRGEILAALGNTGDTAGPHLHFHVADANSTVAAEGVPFVLDSFTLLGRYDSIWAAFKGEPWRALTGSAARVERELPAANVVVAFPGAAQAR